MDDLDIIIWAPLIKRDECPKCGAYVERNRTLGDTSKLDELFNSIEPN